MPSSDMVAAPPERYWLAEAMARVASASGVGHAAAAWTVSRWLTRPTHSRVPKLPPDLPHACEAVECRTADVCRLAGWVVTPPAPRATVALFHGIRANRTQTLDRIAFLAAAGYRCVAFDHRAHGASSGNRTSFGFHESQDVTAVMGLVQQRWPDEPCAAIGISMGGAAICYAGGVLEGVNALILESVYADVASAFTSRIGNTLPSWVAELSAGVIGVTERRLGVRLAQLAPAAHVAALAPRPILFVTGQEDPHATPADLQRLAARYPGPAEHAVVPGARHKDLCTVGGLGYQLRVLDFLERRLFSTERAHLLPSESVRRHFPSA